MAQRTELSHRQAQAAIDAVRRLQGDLKEVCGLPDRLRDADVKEEQLEAISRLAEEDGTTFFNPTEVTFETVSKKIKEAY